MRSSFILILFLFALPLSAEELRFGVVAETSQEFALFSESPAGYLRRRLEGVSIIERPSRERKGSFVSSDIIASIQVSPDYQNWLFSLKEDLYFTNGKPIRSLDIAGSLEYCSERFRPDLAKFLQATKLKNLLQIELLLYPQKSLEDYDYFVELLSSCIVFPISIVDGFGTKLGQGTNLVSASLYSSTEYVAESELYLRRQLLRKSEDRLTPPGIVLKSFENFEQALSAIRSGSVAALLLEQGILQEERLEGDETLGVTRCGRYEMLFRRDLEFQCQPELIASSIRYHL